MPTYNLQLITYNKFAILR